MKRSTGISDPRGSLERNGNPPKPRIKRPRLRAAPKSTSGFETVFDPDLGKILDAGVALEEEIARKRLKIGVLKRFRAGAPVGSRAAGR